MDHSAFLDAPTSPHDAFLDAPTASIDPATGDMVEPDKGLIGNITEPFKHPIEFAKKHGAEIAGAGAGATEFAEAAVPLAAASGALAPIVETGAAAAGAFFGGGVGKAAQTGVEEAGKATGIAEGKPRTPEQIKAGISESAKSMAGAEVLGKVVGEPIAKGAQKAWGAVKPSISKAISETTARGIKAAQDIGIPLTYGQLSQSKIFLGIEGYMRAFPLFGDLMAVKDLQATKALSTARSGLLTTLGPQTTAEGLGSAAKQEMETSLTAAETSRLQRYGLDKENVASGFPAPELQEARRAGMEQSAQLAKNKSLAQRSRLYAAADQANDPGAMIDLAPLKAQGQAITDEFGKEGAKNLRGPVYTTAASYANPALPDSVKGVPQEVIDYVKKNPEMKPPEPRVVPAVNEKGLPYLNPGKQMPPSPKDIMLFNAAQKLPPEHLKAIANQGKMNVLQLQNEINQLGDKAEQNRVFPGGDYNAAGRQYLRMQKAAKNTLDAHFASASPEARRLYALADTFHGAYSETYRNSTLKKIWGENPNATFLSVAQGGSDIEIKRLERALNGTPYPGKGPAPQTGANILKRQLFDQIFSEAKNGIPTEAEALAGLSKYGAAVRAIFSKTDQDALRQFATKGDAPQFFQSEYDIAAKGLIKGASPQELTNKILSGNILLARSAKKYLPSKTWQAFGRQLAENITTAVPGPSVEQGFAGIRKRVESYEPEYLQEFFSPKSVEGMKKIGDASQILPQYGDLAQKAPSSQGFGSRATMMMGGMLLYHFGSPKLAYLAITAPMIGELYTSEMGQKFLTTLMRMPQDDPRVGKLVQQTIGYLARTVAPAEWKAMKKK